MTIADAPHPRAGEMLSYIDSHVHLADPAFDADRESVIARARAGGAEGAVCIGESLDAAARARALAGAHPGWLAWTCGVHPHDAGSFDAARVLPALRELVAQGAAAIGECGLDYHHDNAPRELQRSAFAAQLELARELRRPVVVHTRDAEEDTAALVRDAGAAGVRGVLHCFTGTARLAEVALEAGWYISFSGIITFRRWADEALLRMVPSDRLLVESDAPFLAPVPHRGRRNEPAWVACTIERLAHLRGEAPGAAARSTARNARVLFALAATEPA